jgi:hypothetical protein
LARAAPAAAIVFRSASSRVTSGTFPRSASSTHAASHALSAWNAAWSSSAGIASQPKFRRNVWAQGVLLIDDRDIACFKGPLRARFATHSEPARGKLQVPDAPGLGFSLLE